MTLFFLRTHLRLYLHIYDIYSEAVSYGSFAILARGDIWGWEFGMSIICWVTIHIIIRLGMNGSRIIIQYTYHLVLDIISCLQLLKN